MKLSELKSIKPYVNLPTRFGLAGLILAALILATVVGVSLVSFSGASARKVYAAPLSFHDELQLQLGSDGFTPAEVQRAAGTFAIAVVNWAPDQLQPGFSDDRKGPSEGAWRAGDCADA